MNLMIFNVERVVGSIVDCVSVPLVEMDFYFYCLGEISGVWKDEWHALPLPRALKYFTFGCGISIGLRSGDVLIFNPQIDHCISTNTEHCRESGVMTTSHYYKSSVIGLNDNDIPFSK